MGNKEKRLEQRLRVRVIELRCRDFDGMGTAEQQWKAFGISESTYRRIIVENGPVAPNTLNKIANAKIGAVKFLGNASREVLIDPAEGQPGNQWTDDDILKLIGDPNASGVPPVRKPHQKGPVLSGRPASVNNEQPFEGDPGFSERIRTAAGHFCDAVCKLSDGERAGRIFDALDVEFTSDREALAAEVESAIRRRVSEDTGRGAIFREVMGVLESERRKVAVRGRDHRWICIAQNVLFPFMLPRNTLDRMIRDLCDGAGRVVEDSVVTLVGAEIVASTAGGWRAEYKSDDGGKTVCGAGLIHVEEAAADDPRATELNVLLGIADSPAFQGIFAPLQNGLKRLERERENVSESEKLEWLADAMNSAISVKSEPGFQEDGGVTANGRVGRYYCVFLPPADSGDRARVRSLMTAVAGWLPDLAFFELCETSGTVNGEMRVSQYLSFRFPQGEANQQA